MSKPHPHSPDSLPRVTGFRFVALMKDGRTMIAEVTAVYPSGLLALTPGVDRSEILGWRHA